MSLNSAALKMLADKGFTSQEMVEFAALIEDKPRSKAAERQARYRQNKLIGVTNDVTGDATDDVTRPPKDNSNPLSSEANASAALPAADPVKEMFDLGISLLTTSGVTETRARSLLGKWRKAKKSEGDVISGLLECRAKSISEPVEWLEARFKSAKWVSQSGYEYRGTDEQVLREAERRNDMDTYWRVKGSLKQKAA